MRKVTFKFKTTLFVAICFALLTGCMKSSLPDSFSEEEVKSSAEEVITILNKKDSEALLNMSTVQMKNALTDDVLEGIYEAIGEGGEFKNIEDMSVGGSKDKASEEEFAVTVTKAKYENKTFTYTISFTKQMKIAGLFYK